MDEFGGFLGKHITVKCEVCEKDILKDTIISAIEDRVATKPQNCRHSEEIEDDIFKNEDKEDLRHTIGASNVYSLTRRITSNDNFHENRIKIDVMNEAFEGDKDLDLRNQLRVSDSHRCHKKRRHSDDLREKIQENTIKKLKAQLEISHQSQIQMEEENKKEMQELRKKCEKEKKELRFTTKELGQMQLKVFKTREEKIEVDLRQSQTQLKELNVKYEQQSNKYEVQLQKLSEQFEMEKKKEIQDWKEKYEQQSNKYEIQLQKLSEQFEMEKKKEVQYWKEKYERQSKVLKNYKLQLLERRF